MSSYELKANDPNLRSWVDVAADSDFSIQNLPFGVYAQYVEARVCSAIGDYIVDLYKVQELGWFDGLEIPTSALQNRYLNELMGLNKNITRALRHRISDLLDEGHSENEALRARANEFLIPMSEVDLFLPIQIGDYTDFYSSIEHATNVGTMFRGPENALMPNWRHLPVGYHGRASSIVVSGTPIRRPKGQQKPNAEEPPVYGPCRLLDFELEMAFVIGQKSELGQPISTAEAEDHIFGLMLFNDWSARDIQKWEYVPLGPFLGKNFASTVSPWIVTLDALEPFRVAGPVQEPAVLPYLQYEGNSNYDIHLDVVLEQENGQQTTISQSNFKYMYWNMRQQLAHHTVNGCNVNIGDMCASGTISGKEPSSYGSMLELSWRGTKPVPLGDGSERKFLQDGDSLILRGYGMANGVRVGFGEARGKVLPALD